MISIFGLAFLFVHLLEIGEEKFIRDNCGSWVKLPGIP